MEFLGFPNFKFWILVIAFGLSLACHAQDGDEVQQSLENLELSPHIPVDVVVTEPPSPTLASLQRDFDLFSWKTFIALNWPVDENGAVDPNTVIGDTPSGDNATVWETWKRIEEVFRPGGQPPTPWGAPPEIPDACREVAPASSEIRILSQAGKVPLAAMTTFGQAFNTGPLIDQNGCYVRYEILINKSMFDYIVDNQLYSRVGQERFKGPIDFPQGSHEAKAVGAIMIKAAWKPVGANDPPDRFHKVKALIYTPPSEDPPIEEKCELMEMALVGIHIVHRTAEAPQWSWATFEHVDNAPVFHQGKSLVAHYNFYNSQIDAPINVSPKRPWNPNVKTTPTQVVRLVATTEPTHALNHNVQQQLSGVSKRSVWQYYELVSTQWPTDPDNPVSNPLGTPAPQFLANTTMETYIQGVVDGNEVKTVPNATSSCMGCHNNATTATGLHAGFTYMLKLAQ